MGQAQSVEDQTLVQVVACGSSSVCRGSDSSTGCSLWDEEDQTLVQVVACGSSSVCRGSDSSTGCSLWVKLSL